MKLSHGSIGFSLEHIALKLMQCGAMNAQKNPVSNVVLARIEAAIAAEKK